jgi:hypothetical protein
MMPPPQPQYTPPPAKKSKLWLWILVILLSMSVGYGMGSGGHGSNDATTTDTTTQSTPVVDTPATQAPQPTTAPTKPPQPVKPKIVMTVKGNGDKMTDAFTVDRPWILQWACAPSAYVDEAPLYISLYDTSGALVDWDTVSTSCKAGNTSGDTQVPQTGTMQIKVISGIDWAVRVVE